MRASLLSLACRTCQTVGFSCFSTPRVDQKLLLDTERSHRKPAIVVFASIQRYRVTGKRSPAHRSCYEIIKRHSLWFLKRPSVYVGRLEGTRRGCNWICDLLFDHFRLLLANFVLLLHYSQQLVFHFALYFVHRGLLFRLFSSISIPRGLSIFLLRLALVLPNDASAFFSRLSFILCSCLSFMSVICDFATECLCDRWPSKNDCLCNRETYGFI